MSARRAVQEATHWVVKLGSNVLLADGGLMDRPTFAHLIHEMDELMRAGVGVTVVSSGAVALGRQLMDQLHEPVASIPRKQALAAIGQPHLLKLYEAEFGHYDRQVAQLLFTRADLDDRQRYLNARRAITQLGVLGVTPIINENDTVATDELRFGDNDQLAAMTAGLVGAHLLVILSDVDGIHEVERDPEGRRTLLERIPHIEAASPTLDRVAGPSLSGVGTGGMVTKVLAARLAARAGIPTVIAPGKRAGVLQALRRGEDVGTLVLPGERAAAGRKVWLGTSARAVGEIVCDEGARRAVSERGASLLPIGVVAVRGDFGEGSVVTLVGEDGQAFALGVSVYGADALRAIKGAHAGEIAKRLGYHLLDCAVHRDNLARV